MLRSHEEPESTRPTARLLDGMALRSCSTPPSVLPEQMSSTNLVSTIIDDRDPVIQYSPDAAWTTCTHAPAAWRLYNNSDTFSKFKGAYIQYTFDGDVSWFLFFRGNPRLTLSIRPSNIGVIKARTMDLALLISVSSTYIP